MTLIALLLLLAPAQDLTIQLHPEWEPHFRQAGVTGTIVIVDERSPSLGEHFTPVAAVYNQPRALQRFSPASTYKIPHTLFALDSGAVRDEFQIFPWDGVARSFPAHNQNQDLRSAVRNSALWVFQGFAKHIGPARARRYLQKINYGNADPTTKSGDYWVDGNLAISAHEQIQFLRRLYRNQLPFRPDHQRLLKDVLVNEAGPDWILRAKTGWQGPMGWWVGWVEWPTGPVFFALNIDTPRRMDDLPKRQAITRAILRSLRALPAAQ